VHADRPLVRISPHAERQMAKRRFPETAVRAVLAEPDRVLPGDRLGTERGDGLCCHPVPALRSRAMKIRYDAETDTLTLTLRDAPVRESEEERSGVVLDYGANGDLVGLEILDASRRVAGPTGVELEVVPAPAAQRAAAE
jgi:uncharacterized protein YuzE